MVQEQRAKFKFRLEVSFANPCFADFDVCAGVCVCSSGPGAG
jgi:hypothetical protein